MLVVGGRPIELDAHLARLDAGLDALFAARSPRETAELARGRAAGIALGRLRLTVAPEDAHLAARVIATEIDPALVFPSPERAARLRSLIVEGGLGARKWADRGLLEEAEAAWPEGSIALLLDAGGAVLEASRASVFAALGDVLHTPPSDGRILPGIARERAIEVAGELGIGVDEGELTLDDLFQADEVFLTGSVRGVEPARSVDGVDLSSTGELSARIATGLRQRWLG